MKRWSIIILSLLLCFGMMAPLAMAATLTVSASFDNVTRIATISGHLGSEEGQIVSIQVRSPLNQLDYLNQSRSGPSGAFQFTYKISQEVQGTYLVTVGGQNAEAIATATFNVEPVIVELEAKTSPELPDGQNDWYLHPVDVTIEAVNGIPEDNKIEYRINQGDWTTYSSAINVNTDGTHTVEYRSVDEEGIPGKVKSTTIKLDTQSPVTTATASPIDGKNGWYISSPTVTLAATDNISVTQTVYRIDGAEWSTYSQPVTWSVYGVHSLEYKSIDQAGNEEAVKSISLKVDKAAPTLSIALDKTALWPANKKMVTVTANVYALDDMSQIDTIILTSITSNEKVEPDDIQDAHYGTFDTSFKLRAERTGKGTERVYTIMYIATDLAGNKAIATATIKVPHDQGHNNNEERTD
ncbi:MULTISPECIES: OmpL47-type beta-barrel domain-containing protein [unclassified Paenibacillus]|uniref:OmpL47-type beta-barrel domain-containing protein n=1 Tax=unclassified Paenibacillus TaxID=185978 RepID=UPI00278325C0|nr:MULTISPECIES: hypothetical protein [unclassified Paenibacillus]MDQ0898516.1 hypothetical protein [Paenibacillus sp. V4I7]MDQ0915492.1 hypothetical protein [Paenibacillus sp. V4I5]